MDVLYTGNCYRTYPASGVPMSYWDDIKDYNLKTQIHPFMQYQLKLTHGGFSDSKMEEYNGYLSTIAENNLKLKEILETMDLETYKNLNTIKKNLGLNTNANYDFVELCKGMYDSVK